MDTIGYKLFIHQVSLQKWVHVGKKLDLSIEFGNDGIAPIYFNWPTKLFIYNQEGVLVYNEKLEIDIREILPGNFYKVEQKFLIEKLENGIFMIGIAIIDPYTDKPAIRFANENNRPDLIFEIGSFEINRIFNNKIP